MNLTDIDSIQGVYMWLDMICDEECNLSDQELADKLNEVYQFRVGNNPSNSIYLTHHYRSEMIVKQRARRYCKKNHIKLKNYNGLLPYRTFVIDILPDINKNRRLKLEKIIKVQKRKVIFNKIKSLWKHIFGREN